MASKSKKSTKGKTGGRTSSSEPRLQVFKDFSGCNFELSPRDMLHSFFDVGVEDQSDLQMNYVVVQNNLNTTSNRTFETRNKFVPWYKLPSGKKFTGVASSVGKGFIAAINENGQDNVYYVEGDKICKQIPTTDSNGIKWSSFGVVEDNILALCEPKNTQSVDEQYQIYKGKIDKTKNFPDALNGTVLKPPVYIYDPTIPLPTIEIQGLPYPSKVEYSVGMSDTVDEQHPYRITLAYAYVNEFGTTKLSPSRTYYSDTPVTRFSAESYIRFTLPCPSSVKAVEFFYSTDDAMELKFAGRVEAGAYGSSGNYWEFTFTGYVEMPENWILGSSVAPDANYTLGPPASYFNVVDGRLYYWGDNNRLYWGGVPGNLFSVSRGYGGGFIDINPVEAPKIRYVDKYKTQSGANTVTVLCDSNRSSREQRYNLVETNTSISNESSTQANYAEQVAGAVGCKSPYGARVCQDGLYAVSRYGLALTTMTMEYNSQIATNYVSSAISPVFTDKLGVDLSNAILFESNGVLYLAFGKTDEPGDYENIIFCYDISAKAWWTYTVPAHMLDSGSIINMVHIDGENGREGIAVITPREVWFLPLTQDDSPEDDYTRDDPVLIMTGELSTQMPLQSYQYLSQIEFHFDYFRGFLDVRLDGIDIFGRKIKIEKRIESREQPGESFIPKHYMTEYNFTEYMRVDLKLRSYKLTFKGNARMRMTHWISKVYTMSNKMGLVWGFDDRMSYRSFGDIHPTFRNYNDIKNAIIP